MVDILDLYMENFDEGKNDTVIPNTCTRKKSKKQRIKERVPSRRKIGYSKAAKRMDQLNNIGHYVPDAKDFMIVRGILRKHQLPMKDYPCKFSISAKRRLDSAQYKMIEAYVSA